MRIPTRHQSGQALAESLVLLLVLLPFALALEQLSQLPALQQEVLAATRHGLLERFHDPGRNPVAPASLDQFLGEENARVVAVRRVLGTSEPLAIESEWGAFPLPGSASLAAEVVALAVAAAEPIGQGRLDLQPGEYVRLQLRLRVLSERGVGPWTGGQPLVFEESLAVLTDSWQTFDSPQLARRINALTAASYLAQIATPLKAVGTVLSVIEPSFRQFCPGRLALEIVPADRVAASSHSDMRAVPC